MYVVNLGLDPKTLDAESVVAFRNRAYGKLTEHYSIIVPSPTTMTVHLSDATTVYGVGGSNKALQLLKMFWLARSLIKAGKCDVLTSQDMYFLGLIGLILAHVYTLGFEVQVLGIEKLTLFRKTLAVFVLKRAGIIRALSNRLKERLIREFGVSETNINVVTIYVNVNKLGLDVRTLNPSDTQSFERLVTDFKKTYSGNTNFLTVSRLVPIKRISMQIDAVSELVSESPNIRLHIVGDGPDAPSLKKYVQSRGLEKHVIFHGYQSGYALGMFYMECDCFVITSDYEGWGMVVIEAATAGLPIIMTDVGCAGEFITHGVSGLIIPPKDTQALKDAMRKIINDSEERERLSVGAMSVLALLPSFDTILEQYKQNWEVAYSRR